MEDQLDSSAVVGEKKRKIKKIIIILIVVLAVLFPFRNRYQNKTLGWVTSSHGIYHFDSDLFSDEPGNHRITCRIRTGRFWGRDVEEYPVWRYPESIENGIGKWLKTTGTATGGGVFRAVSGMDYDEETGRLSFSHDMVSLPIVWDVPAKIRNQVESGQFAPLSAELLSCQWGGMESGELVTDVESGEQRAMKHDLANLDVTIRLTNHSRSTEYAPRNLYLASEDEQLLVTRCLDPVDPKSGEIEKNITIAPGERVTITMSTMMDYYKYLDRLGDLILINLSEGWRWEVPKLPSSKKLYATESRKAYS